MKTDMVRKIFLLSGLLLSLSPFAAVDGHESSVYSDSKYDIAIKADRADARYRVGEMVSFEVAVLKNGKPVDDSSWSYKMLQDGLNVVDKGGLKWTDGKCRVSFKWDKPSFLLLIVSPPASETNCPSIRGGAACEPEKLAASMPKPDDFDAFWNGKKALLDAMTNPPVLTPVSKYTDSRIETYALCMENINGSHIYGFFAKPKGDGPFPAILLLNSAGVFSIKPNSVVSYAQMGAMAIDINPHDLENEQSGSYYEEARAGRIKGYPLIGRDDRENSYFLRMFCACYRVGRYLCKRSEWDKKHFLVHGASMGGGQAFAMAYLCPEVTAFAANVPALCDHTGREAGRAPGWPNMVSYANGQADQKQLNTARYFDCVNFARSIHARALVSAGFVDMTCAPGSVYAAYNVLTGNKQMVDMPIQGHSYPKEFSKTWNDFLKVEMGWK